MLFNITLAYYRIPFSVTTNTLLIVSAQVTKICQSASLFPFRTAHSSFSASTKTDKLTKTLVLAKLAERWLPTSEFQGSNPIINNFIMLSVNGLEKTKLKKKMTFKMLKCYVLKNNTDGIWIRRMRVFWSTAFRLLNSYPGKRQFQETNSNTK